MVNRQFEDRSLAALYDLFCPWQRRNDFRFYLGLMRADPELDVLDVGCGTGMMLHRARDAGHTGRLCGLDPADGMLAQARLRSDIEWVYGDLGSVGWDREFDLVVMTGHAFQELVADDELRTALAGIRSALRDGGRFAFETRNPAARAWAAWVPENVAEVAMDTGGVARSTHQVETPVTGDLVSFTTTITMPGLDEPQTDRTTLRFLDAAPLGEFLAEARLTVEEQYGYWDRTPVTGTSPEIITIARR